MNNLHKDILIGGLFIAGILSFTSGLFVFSAAIFAATSMLSSINGRAKLEG